MIVSADAAQDKASILIEALPYIRTYRGRTVVIKIGGAAMDDPEAATSVASDIALLSMVGIKVVVVHGGGPQVSAAMSEAGLQPRFVQGIRVTDEATMAIVQQVLIGTINQELTARLAAAGLVPVGLAGADGGLFEARRVGGALAGAGLVGEIERVDPEVLRTLLDGGYTPVIASVARADGHAVNVNADVVASAVSGVLQAAKLVLLTNVAGLYADLGDSGSLISALKRSDLEEMLPDLSDGMRPKAQAAIDALAAGVGKVHILDGRVRHALLVEIFTDEGIGTEVVA